MEILDLMKIKAFNRIEEKRDIKCSIPNKICNCVLLDYAQKINFYKRKIYSLHENEKVTINIINRFCNFWSIENLIPTCDI